MDRQSRAPYIIFFNTSEFTSLPGQLTDTSTVNEILNCINFMTVRRLGKQSNKPRPLLATLPSTS